MRKRRKINKIIQDIKPIITEMKQHHRLSKRSILALVYSWLVIHRPDAQEEYVDGGSPEFFYGFRK